MKSKPTRIYVKAISGLIAMMTAGIGVSNVQAEDENFSSCPWIVQPDEPLVGLGADIATYEILFNGTTSDAIFYGFTVTDHILARHLTNDGEIPALEEHGRPLEVIEREGIPVYQLSADSILPRTIYLLASAGPISRLEQIEARIDPARPIAVGLRTRGASDLNGPMPRRMVPGIEILVSASRQDEEEKARAINTASLDPDFQLCAYQVSWN